MIEVKKLNQVYAIEEKELENYLIRGFEVIGGADKGSDNIDAGGTERDKDEA
ncbi:hypothetical protein FACS1894188_10190 [Clostridia bacterium]|nr:hypothetical protein FACS1894188_10190 [Clostridia bacterium]